MNKIYYLIAFLLITAGNIYAMQPSRPIASNTFHPSQDLSVMSLESLDKIKTFHADLNASCTQQAYSYAFEQLTDAVSTLEVHPDWHTPHLKKTLPLCVGYLEKAHNVKLETCITNGIDLNELNKIKERISSLNDQAKFA